MLGEPQDSDDDRGADDDHEHSRHPARESRQREQDDKAGDPHDKRRGAGLVEAREERSHLADEPAGIGRKAEQPGELADDDRDAEAVHVADLDLA